MTKIIQLSPDSITPYHRNPRQNSAAVDKVADSIREFGFNQPIVVDHNNVVVVGHTRLKAAQKLGLDTVPTVTMDSTDEGKIRSYRIADNKLNELAEWDNDLLLGELEDIESLVGDIEMTGFKDFEKRDLESQQQRKQDGWNSLSEKYIVPPFSILDARQGDWALRKKRWLDMGIRSELGRDDGLAYPTEGFGAIEGKGTSIFDPALTEVLYTWFSKQGDHILDPFAGGSVRGAVASLTGRSYTGIDLRAEQVQANKDNWTELKQLGYPLRGYTHKTEPEWLEGNSDTKLDNLDQQYDLIFTCPPYADLEVYSDLDDDISNMDYEQFKQTYNSIIAKSCSRLKDDHFAVVVIGEARDKNGNYYNLIGDTITAFRSAGLELYNEIIYITPNGTLSTRAERPFRASRKVGKHHQNALVFLKGDVAEHHEKALVFLKGNSKTATDHAGRIEIDTVRMLMDDNTINGSTEEQIMDNLSQTFNLEGPEDDK